MMSKSDFVLKSNGQEITSALNTPGMWGIVTTLARSPEEWVTLNWIWTKASVPRTRLKSYLARLISLGWVEVRKDVVGARTFRLNSSNPRTQSFLRFLEEADFFS